MPDHNPQPAHVGCATSAVMLKTVVNRIARKAEIMALDAARSSSARQDAEEIRALTFTVHNRNIDRMGTAE